MGLGSFIKNAVSGASGGLLKGAAEIVSKFVTDPNKKLDAQQKLAEIQAQHEKDMATIEVQLAEIDAKQLESVNQTMREESKSEHFLQWAWRPIVGLTFCAVIINNYIIIPYLKNKGVLPIDIPDDVWMAMLVILGAASAGRGWAKAEKAKKA
jgi:hypothetical protein